MKPARIKFLTPELGGREVPPQDVKINYYALAGSTPNPQDARWTFVVEFDDQPTEGNWTPCRVNYLAYSHPRCPPLTTGTKLNLFEGHRLVAHVEVTG